MMPAPQPHPALAEHRRAHLFKVTGGGQAARLVGFADRDELVASLQPDRRLVVLLRYDNVDGAPSVVVRRREVY